MIASNAHPDKLKKFGSAVKGRIVTSNLRLAELAKQAGIPASRLSDMLRGANRKAENQWQVWQAYRELTGSQISLQEFWGRLLSERISA